MPSIFTLEGPRLGATAADYTILSTSTTTAPTTTTTAPPKQQIVRFPRRMVGPIRLRALRGLGGTAGAKAWLYVLLGLVVTGGAFAFLASHAEKAERPKRRALRGPDMLKVIARESRSPAEYARRAEAWNAAEAHPLSVAKLAKAYPKAEIRQV